MSKLLGSLTLVLGIIALRDCRKRSITGWKRAIFAIVIGAIYSLLLLVLVIARSRSTEIFPQPIKKNDGVKASALVNNESPLEILRKEAEQGDPKAQYDYGERLFINENDTEAMKWYGKAAEQGNVNAQFVLGMGYAKGLGLPKDATEAMKWFRKAAEQSHAEAQNILGEYYLARQDGQEAVKWLRLAAEQGESEAQKNLGVCYLNGIGVDQDFNEAFKWTRKAAEQGNDVAQKNLGLCYEEGLGVEQDIKEAVKWYQRAAKQGNEDAIEILNELSDE